MRMHLAALLLASAAASTLVVRAQAEPDTATALTLQVGGAVEAPSSMTNEELRSRCEDDLEQVTYTIRGEQHQATCIALAKLVAQARPKLPEGRKGWPVGRSTVARSGDAHHV
ncbi:MAG: hypothetical protein H6806_07095 [Planctomycetes bacterium]|nr:hypothetical protein [Planctomycetota bacterium]